MQRQQQASQESFAQYQDTRMIQNTIIIPVIINNQQLLQMTMKCLVHIGQTVNQKKDAEGKPIRDTEVILVDNGSQMPAYFKTDVYVKNPGNIGYGPAINQGIKLAAPTSKYIIPMNNDVFVNAGWLEPLLEELEKDPTIGVIRPVAVGQSNYGTEKQKFGQGKVAIDQKDYHGFCYVIPRHVLDKLEEWDEHLGPHSKHYFDEQFAPAYCEDMDMWVRMTKAGFKMAKHFSSVVEHIGGASGPSANIGNSLQENRKKFFLKHGFDVFSEPWYSNWQELATRFGPIV